MLHKNGIKTAIITGRESEIVNIRARELSIDCVYQNVSDKVETLKQIVELYGISIEEVAYIGDDLNDFEAMKKCGITGCPADAVDEIKNISDYTSKFNGGDGAIRDFVDWILKNKV